MSACADSTFQISRGDVENNTVESGIRIRNKTTKNSANSTFSPFFFFFVGWTFLWLSCWTSLVLSLHRSDLEDPNRHNEGSLPPNRRERPCLPPLGLTLRAPSRTWRKAKYWRIFSSFADPEEKGSSRFMFTYLPLIFF